MIEVAELQKHFADGERERTILDGLTLSVGSGEYVAVVGESGSGKSTLLNIVGGLDRDYRGAVSSFGQDLAKLSDADLSAYRNRRVGFVFQSFHLVGHLSCLDNVMLPAHFGPRRDPAESTNRATSLLERVGLGNLAHRRPGALSGGEKQRVVIARALFNEPELILADEPTGNLDRDTGESILDLFDGLRSERHVTLVMVTHETRLAARADRVLRLDRGRLVADSKDSEATS